MPTMQEYQRYRVNRREPHTTPKKLIGWAVIIIAGVLLLWLFFRGGEQAPTTVTNENANTNTNVEATTEETNVNASESVEETTEPQNASFESIDTVLADYNPGEQCDDIISRPASAEVLLTFGLRLNGDGYQDVLATLTSENVPAAFFVSGNWADDHTDILQAITDAGFPVYNQTQSHEDLTELSEDTILQELEQGNETISGITGRSTQPFMRPPFGAIDDAVFDAAVSAGYCPVLWSVDALDWQAGATSFDVISRITDSVTTSGLILMHVGSDPTPDALPEVIRLLRDDGMSFVSLEQFATTQ